MGQAALRVVDKRLNSPLKLFEIADGLATVLDEIEEAGGEMTPDQEARLDALEGAWPVKVERVALVIEEFEAKAEAASAAARRMSDRALAATRSAKALRSYLERQMRILGQSNVEAGTVKVRIQDNPIAVAWSLTPEECPDEYRVERVTCTVNKALALAHHKAGIELPEGFTVARGTHLRIS